MFQKWVKTRQNYLDGVKLIYMQKHRKSDDFRCFVSEIIGNTAAISAWRTGERDVRPSDRTAKGGWWIYVALQQFFRGECVI